MLWIISATIFVKCVLLTGYVETLREEVTYVFSMKERSFENSYWLKATNYSCKNTP